MVRPMKRLPVLQIFISAGADILSHDRVAIHEDQFNETLSGRCLASQGNEMSLSLPSDGYAYSFALIGGGIIPVRLAARVGSGPQSRFKISR